MRALRPEPLDEPREEDAGIRLDGEPRRVVAVQDLAVDVDVDQVLGRLQSIAPGRHLAEAAADGEQAVAALHHAAHEARRGGAEARPQPQRVALRDHALAVDGGGDGGAEALGERDHQRGGVAGAVADVERRAPRRTEQPRRLVELLRGRRGRLGGGGLVFERRHVLAQDQVVGRHLEGHRAGAAGARQVEGLAHQGVDLARARDLELGLGHRAQHGELVDVVELEGVTGVVADAGDQHHQGHGVHVGLGHAREGVAHARPRHHVDQPDARRRARDAVGHERGRLLVGDQDRLDLIRALEGVVELDVVGAGDAEGKTHAFGLQRLDHDLGAAPPHAARSSAMSRRRPSATRSAIAMMVT